MVQTWEPTISDLQTALKELIEAQHTTDKASLHEQVREHFRAVVGLGPDWLQPTPVTVHVFPPSGTGRSMPSDSDEVEITIPCLIRLNALSEADQMQILLEVQGLIIDAARADRRIKEKAHGPAHEQPFWSIGPIDIDGGMVTQEVQVNVYKVI